MDAKLSILKKNILVLGDVMLDCYYCGKVKRISPEAPVPIFLKDDVKYVLGGAANVVSNLLAANQNVFLATIVGNDNNGEILINKLQNRGCNCSGVIQMSGRKTTIKTRLLAQNNQQLLRIDEEQNNFIQEKEEEILFNRIINIIQEMDIIVISDYLKGVLTVNLVQRTIDLAKEFGKPVFIDIKDKTTNKYNGATLLKPNRNELAEITGLSTNTKPEVLNAAKKLRTKCNCEYVLATLGNNGMLLLGEEIEEWIPCIEREVYDVSGAGDTVISYLASAFVNGYNIVESSYIANYAAGIKVTKIGTSPVPIKELCDEYSKSQKRFDVVKKVVRLDELKEFLKNWLDLTVVFTNGCFDILHSGHIEYLRTAAELGDVLIVGLNSDDSINRLKGKGRPVNRQEDRALVLSALEFVDYIVVFDEDTPLKLIENIKPDILVKGADYKKEDVVGAKFVEENGGKVELVKFLEGYSTTNIIRKMEAD